MELIRSLQAALVGGYSSGEAQAVVDIVASSLYGFDRFEALLWPDRCVEEFDEDTFRDVCRRLAEGCPVQYVVGSTEFCGRKFLVQEGVLIPRPETEELVTLMVKENSLAHPRILDAGTGSGAIAVSLAAEIVGSHVTAIDISTAALEVAKKNAALNNVSVVFAEADVFNYNPVEKFDIIVSNPPYIPSFECSSMRKNVVCYEPSIALFVPDDDPLKFYRRIAEVADNTLTAGGRLYFEAHERFADQVSGLLHAKGFVETEVVDDMNAKPRIVKCRKTN